MTGTDGGAGSAALVQMLRKLGVENAQAYPLADVFYRAVVVSRDYSENRPAHRMTSACQVVTAVAGFGAITVWLLCTLGAAGERIPALSATAVVFLDYALWCAAALPVIGLAAFVAGAQFWWLDSLFEYRTLDNSCVGPLSDDVREVLEKVALLPQELGPMVLFTVYFEWNWPFRRCWLGSCADVVTRDGQEARVAEWKPEWDTETRKKKVVYL